MKKDRKLRGIREIQKQNENEKQQQQQQQQQQNKKPKKTPVTYMAWHAAVHWVAKNQL